MLLLSKASTESSGKAEPELPQAAGREPEKLLLFREKTCRDEEHVSQAANDLACQKINHNSWKREAWKILDNADLHGSSYSRQG